MEALSAYSNVERLDQAFDIAERHLGIAKLLDANGRYLSSLSHGLTETFCSVSFYFKEVMTEKSWHQNLFHVLNFFSQSGRSLCNFELLICI